MSLDNGFEKWVKDGETIEDLQAGGLKIIQKAHGFRFGIDAVLLANFVNVRKGGTVLDLGTGTGIIPILLAAKTKAHSISAIEIVPQMVEMASRSIEMNGLSDLVNVVCGDLRECTSYFKPGTFDVVTANPPYMNAGGGLINPHNLKAIARHEIMCTLEDVVKAASLMLKHLGRFYMVHRPARLADIICVMRKYSLEPKALRFVHPSVEKKPVLVLIHGMKGSNPHLNVMPPLILYENGEYTGEIRKMYSQNK